MEKKQQCVLDSLERVSQYLTEYAGILGPLLATSAGRQLQRAIAGTNELALAQGLARRELQGVAEQVHRLDRELKVQSLTPLAKFARAQLGAEPGLKAVGRVPYHLQGRRLAHAARAMASAADPHADKLAEALYSDDGAGDVRAAADLLDRTLDDRSDARSRRVMATAGITDQLSLGRRAVALLDAVVTRKVAERPELIAGWRAAKRVARSSASKREIPAATTSAAG
jgi:hypothetical protein